MKLNRCVLLLAGVLTPGAAALADRDTAPPLPSGLTEPRPTQGGAVAAKKLTDAQILGDLDAMNDQFIALSRVAAGSKNGEVKHLADKISKDHEDAKQKQADLAKELKMSPVQTDHTKAIRSTTAKEVEKLEKLTGEHRDRAYAELMARQAKESLSFIDKRALPATANKQLKTLLADTVRPGLVHNQKLAQDLEKKLAPPPKPASGG